MKKTNRNYNYKNVENAVKSTHHILIENHARSASSPSSHQIKKWVCFALMHAGTIQHQKAAHLINIRIVTAQTIQHFNDIYLKKNKPTNVLSFPTEISSDVQLSPKPLGDILIAASYVNREAREQQKANDAHWAHMIIHSVLHLLGYDHHTHRDAHRMETLEIQLLSKLGYPNPYHL